MWQSLSYLKKNLIWTVPMMMLLGVLFGGVVNAAFLKQAVLPITFLMVYPMMVTMQLDKIFSKEDMGSQIAAQLLNFGLIPFVALGVGKLFFADKPFVILGLLLVGLLPTSGMTISWTGFAKGNINAAVKMTVFGRILGALLAPFYIRWLMGTAVTVPVGKMLTQIGLIVFVPLLLGYATQKWLIKRYGRSRFQQEFKRKFPLLATIGVLAMVFVAMALKAKSIISNPIEILSFLPPLLLFYGISFTVGSVVGKYLFPRSDGIALVYGTAIRGLSIALAIAMTAFGKNGSEIALIIALGFVVQVQAAVWYEKITGLIFGRPETAVTPPTAGN